MASVEPIWGQGLRHRPQALATLEAGPGPVHGRRRHSGRFRHLTDRCGRVFRHSQRYRHLAGQPVHWPTAAVAAHPDTGLVQAEAPADQGHRSVGQAADLAHPPVGTLRERTQDRSRRRFTLTPAERFAMFYVGLDSEGHCLGALPFEHQRVYVAEARPAESLQAVDAVNDGHGPVVDDYGGQLVHDLHQGGDMTGVDLDFPGRITD